MRGMVSEGCDGGHQVMEQRGGQDLVGTSSGNNREGRTQRAPGQGTTRRVGPRGRLPSRTGYPRTWVPRALRSPVTRCASTVPWTLSPASRGAPVARW